jgi:ABC-2 type transport system ATP-binding protein
MSEVIKVSPIQPSGLKPDSYRIQTANPEIVRKQILELALLHNLNIVSLQSEDQSLEEVFRSLTQKTE